MVGVSEEQVLQALSYTSDKDRLELELRKNLLIRLMEKTNIEQEKALLTLL